MIACRQSSYKLIIQIMPINRQYKISKFASEPRMHQLVKELLRVWCSKEVDQNYQNYFLSYLDTLPTHLVESQISQEIKFSLENKSHFFKIKKVLDVHNNVLSRLQEQVTNLQDREDITEHNLRQVCSLIEELRDSNLLVAQTTLNLNYKCLSMGRYESALIQGNNHIFNKLNADNQFLKSSFLRKYITFSSSYDPFFLHHYETLKKNAFKFKKISCIDDLFNMPISLTYKLMKSQQQILEFLCGRVPHSINNSPNKDSSYTEGESQIDRDYSSRHQSPLRQSKQKGDYMTRARTDETQYLKGPNQNFNMRYSDEDPSNIQLEKSQLRIQLPRLSQHSPERGARKKSFAFGYNSTAYSDVHKYMFKIRRPSIKHQHAGSPISPRKRSETLNNSIKIIQEKEEEFSRSIPKSRKNIRPLGIQPNRYEEQETVKRNQTYRKSSHQQLHEQRQVVNKTAHTYALPKKRQVPEVREMLIQTQPDSSRQLPLNKKTYVQSIVQTLTTPLKVQKSSEPVKKPISAVVNNLKNFKLKAGNLNVKNIFAFLHELEIKEQYRKTFEVANWQSSIKNNQYYLHKFYINQILHAISLCCALPEGDILIKYWGPLEICDEQTSSTLFKKYLEYIERNSLSKSIFYNAVEIREVLSNGFAKQRERIYVRARKTNTEVDGFNYYPFLSIDFSNIAVAKTTNKDLLNDMVVHTYDAYPFNQNQFICMNYLLMINKLEKPGSFSSICTFTAGLKTIKEANTKMIEQEIANKPYQLDSPVSPVNLLTFRMRNPLFSAFFIANKHFVKLSGEQVYEEEQKLIVSLQLLKLNSVMYFAKGFRSIADVFTVLKAKNNSKRRIQYCVRMFRKHMRGRIQSINLKDQFCYGDIEIIFEWRDFLKGKVTNDINDYQSFGDSTFHGVLQIDRENIFGFEVTDDNFL